MAETSQMRMITFVCSLNMIFMQCVSHVGHPTKTGGDSMSGDTISHWHTGLFRDKPDNQSDDSENDYEAYQRSDDTLVSEDSFVPPFHSTP